MQPLLPGSLVMLLVLIIYSELSKTSSQQQWSARSLATCLGPTKTSPCWGVHGRSSLSVYRKQLNISQKLNIVTIWPSSGIPGYALQRTGNQYLNKYLDENVQSSPIHNGQKMEMTQCLWMNRQNVVPIKPTFHICTFLIVDSVNHGSKIFGKKNFKKFQKAKLEFTSHLQLFT